MLDLLTNTVESALDAASELVPEALDEVLEQMPEALEDALELVPGTLPTPRQVKRLIENGKTVVQIAKATGFAVEVIQALILE